MTNKAKQSGFVAALGLDIVVGFARGMRRAVLPTLVLALCSSPAAFAQDPDCSSYCSSNPNCTGNAAVISAQGSTVLANNNFTLRVTGMPPNTPGLLLCDLNQTFVANAFGGFGNLCVGGTNLRMCGPTSNAAGELNFTLDLMSTPCGISSGDTWNFQMFFCDCVLVGLNSSDAISCTFSGGGSSPPVPSSCEDVTGICTVPPTAPPNDLCENAVQITCETSVDGDTTGADVDDSFPTCGSTSIDSPGVWYSIVGTGADITVDTCANTAFDTRISVYAGDCSTPVCVDGDDDTCGQQSSVTWTSTPATQYLILVHGGGGASGSFTLAVTIDSDGDGVSDCFDVCPGFDDVNDSDLDGVPDGCDICPDSDDADDTDFDGVPDGCDQCNGTPDVDSDGDGVLDCNDLCPGFDDSLDGDGDGVADGCDQCPGFNDNFDDDFDGVPDGCDQCPDFDDSFDLDSDGVADGCDQCPDFDDNLDADGDGVPDGCDQCPGVPDVDSDGDGVLDCADICPGSDDSVDGDGDGVPDGCDQCPGAPDLDSDGDGVLDCDDVCPGLDDNLDGDGDGVTECAGDCDDADAGNFPGNAEVCDGLDNDCNGSADDLPGGPDCNTNGVPDDCDIALGTSADLDSNGIPDECPGDPCAGDLESPVLTIPPDLTIECGEPEDPSNTGAASATDNLDQSPIITFSDEVIVTGPCPVVRVIERSWVASDSCGNASAAGVQLISVQDTTPPTVVSIPEGSGGLVCGETDPEVLGFMTVTDNCDPNPTVEFYDVFDFDSQCYQAFLRVWTATDNCGNVLGPFTRFHSVFDTTPPDLMIPADVTIECNDPVGTSPTNTGFATATDGCRIGGLFASTSSGELYSIDEDTGLPATIGALGLGNNFGFGYNLDFDPTTGALYGVIPDSAQESSLITIDPVSGSGTVVGSMTGAGLQSLAVLDIAFAPNGTLYVTGSDPVAGTHVFLRVDKSTGDVLEAHNVPNTYVGLSFSPGGVPWAGNGGNDIFTLNPLNGGILSTLVLSPAVSIYDLAFAPDGTLYGTDRTSPSLFALVTINTTTGVVTPALFEILSPFVTGLTFGSGLSYSDNVASSCPTVLSRTWTATDRCGRTTSLVQTITLEDSTAPTLTLPPDITIECGDPEDPGSTGLATALDSCDPGPLVNFTDNLVLTGNCPVARVIERSWVATDACGNASAAGVQLINVHDSTAPDLTIPADVTFECDILADTSPANTGFATARDGCRIGGLMGSSGLAGLTSESLFSIDQRTGMTTLVGDHGVGGAGGHLYAIDFDPTTGELYGALAFSAGTGSNSLLLKIDPTSGSGTVVGSITAGPGLDAIAVESFAFSPGGTLYVAGVDALQSHLVFLRVDKSTAEVLEANVVHRRYSGLAFSPTGTLWGTDRDAGEFTE